MKRPGFSLLETVVALALFTLCAGILLETVAATRLALFGPLRNGHPDADRRLVVRTILASPEPRSPAGTGRLTSPDDAVLTWRCEWRPTAVTDLHRVVVNLRRETPAGGVTEETFSLYALRPAWSDPVEREAHLARRRSEDPGPYPPEARP